MTGADTITLTRAEYEDLIDARDHAMAMREIASGAMETLPGAEVDAYLAAARPLAFWWRHREDAGYIALAPGKVARAKGAAPAMGNRSIRRRRVA